MKTITVYDWEAKKIQEKADELDITVAEVIEQLVDIAIYEVE